MEQKMFALAEVKAAEGDDPNGSFEVVLSAPTLDRDGEVIDPKVFEPLPVHVTFDIDHGMSTATTVGSGTPYYDAGLLKVKGTYSSIPRAQEVRTLVAEGHIRTTSVAFMGAVREEKDGVPHIVKAELLNGSFVPIPSNREAVVLTAKAFAEKASGFPVVDVEAGDLGAQDTTFLRAMIVHHRSALDMARKYLADTSNTDADSRVSDLAANIVEAQTAEIAMMRSWLGSAGQTASLTGVVDGAAHEPDNRPATQAPVTPAEQAGKSPASDVVELARIRARLALLAVG